MHACTLCRFCIVHVLIAKTYLYVQVPAAMQKDLLFKSYPEKSFHNAMVLANHELHESPVDDMQSGTTAVNILIRGTGLYVANVGDSRAVLAERQGGKNVAINLTVDQTAFRCGSIRIIKLTQT